MNTTLETAELLKRLLSFSSQDRGVIVHSMLLAWASIPELRTAESPLEFFKGCSIVESFAEGEPYHLSWQSLPAGLMQLIVGMLLVCPQDARQELRTLMTRLVQWEDVWKDMTHQQFIELLVNQLWGEG